MAFPDSFVEEVRRVADIVRVISEHVALKKMGTSWKGLCPFHQEKTPSFNVRQEPAVFHCFGCGEGGDVFKFVMLRERVSFPEAIEMLARRFGVPVPEGRVEPGARPQGARGDARADGGGGAALHPHLLGRAGDDGPRVPPRPRLPEGDAGEDPRRGRARRVGRPSRRPAGQVLARAAAQGRPRPRAAGQGGPLRPLPQPRGLPDPERVGQGRGLRRALARQQRAQVPQLPRNARLLEEPHPLRPLLGPRRVRAREARGPDGGLPRRGPRDRAGRGRGGRHLRHRAHRLPRAAAATLRGDGRPQLRPGRGRARRPRARASRCSSRRGSACASWSCRRATTPTRTSRPRGRRLPRSASTRPRKRSSG